MTPSMVNLMKDYMVVALKLFIFPSYIRKQICDVLEGFLSFLLKYEKKRNPWHVISNIRPKI